MWLTILATVIFVLILVIGHEFGHFIVAKLMGATVTEFGFGFPPRLFAKKIGGTEYSLNAIPFGGFVSIYGEGESKNSVQSDKSQGLLSFQDLSAWKRVLVILAGIVMNIIIAWIVFSIVLMIGIPSTVIVTGVQPNTPAAAAGLMVGDQVLNFSTPQQFTSYIDSNLGHSISFEVLRNDQKIDITVTPRANPPAGQGHIGVVIENAGAASENFFKAFYDGAKVTWEVALLTVTAFWGLIVGLFTEHWSALSSVTGPVGIYSIISQATQQGISYLLYLLGAISINLAIINIIPFPALDGGRILMIGIEKISGRRIKPRVENIINAAGMFILLFLMVLITIRDIGRLY